MRKGAALVRDTVERCMKHNTPMLSASLAFYALLSVAPAITFIVSIGGVFVGRREARGDVIDWVTSMIGPDAARLVRGMVDNGGAGGSFTTIASVVSLFFGATVAFGALQDALNLVWEVPSHGRGFVKQFFFKRLVSFVAVMAAGILLVASVLIDALISAAVKFVPQALPATELLLEAANFAISLVLVTVLFAMLYRILPDAWVAWRDVWTGAAVTALLFSVGKLLIGLYLGHTSPSSAFGAAGSVMVFLLWVYYSAQIFLFGAEFTEGYAVARRAGDALPFDEPLPPEDEDVSPAS
jgi:membrane protein